MRGLAAVARELGDGDIRLTVWQNLIISGVPTDKVAAAQARIDALGLSTNANSIRAGLVACTGNVGCKFAASDTKGMRRRSRAGARARRARRTGQHPSHGLPSLLRAALHRRHRTDRLQGRHVRGRRHRRGLPHPCRRRLRPGRGDCARNLPRRQSRGRAAHRRAHAEGLYRAPRLAAGELSRLQPAARRRRAAIPHSKARRPHEPPPRTSLPPLIPESAPFSAEQRVWLDGLSPGCFRSRAGVTPLSSTRRRRCFRRARSPRRRPAQIPRRRRRRRALARPGHGARRAHEACRRPSATPADDGRNGTTGLRTMRIHLSGLFRRHLLKKGRAAESLRARRQGNRPHAQGAASGARQRAGARRRKTPDRPGGPQACRCYGCVGRRAGFFTREPGRGGVSVAHTPQ